MLYHYYSRRFPRDRLNIQGALRHPDEFVNARERERLEMQSRQKSRSYLSSSFCQSPPPPFFFRFYSFLFSLLSGLLCIISFDDLLSFSNALRHGRKRISYSFFCFCFFYSSFIYSRYRRKSGTVGSRSESMPIQSNAVDCFGVLAMSRRRKKPYTKTLE